VERSGLSQSALSQHLAKLREQGLVATRREAQVIPAAA
jgi:ArsR family transcriptional regulator